MHHFNLKSIALYGTMIGSVLILFKFVSEYGENQLKAPQKVSGHYSMQLENTPECLKQKNLTLTIEQSGIYLVAALSSDKSSPKKVKPQFNGNLKEQQVMLLGTPSPLSNCSVGPLKINGTFKKQNLLGQIQGEAFPNPISFKASLKPEPKPESEH